MLDKSVSLTTFRKVISKVGAKSNTNLGELTTSDKTSLVNAINELQRTINSLRQGGVPYGKELTESWKSLHDRIVEGDFHDIYIGDYKTITLTTGEKVVMEVAGIDTYYEYFIQNKGNHHIDFISRDCIAENKRINPTNNNNGTEDEPRPWLASELYQALNNETTGIYATLPSDLTPYIIEKSAYIEERYSDKGDLSSDTSVSVANIGKLWLPTEIEVYGHCVWSDQGFGTNSTQYPIFIGGYKHIIKHQGIDGPKTSWWELSVDRLNSIYWCFVGGGGPAAGTNASGYLGVPLCFRIG